MEVHKEDIMTILNLEDAEKHVGELGYFANRPYTSLGLWKRGVLAEVLKHEEVGSVFYAVDEDEGELNYYGSNYFGLFIPEERIFAREKREAKNDI